MFSQKKKKPVEKTKIPKNIKVLVPAAVALLFSLGAFAAIPRYNFTIDDAYINLGNSLFEKHEYDDPIVNFKKAVSLKPDAHSYIQLENAYFAKNDYNKALASYNRAINKNPDYYPAYFNMGIAYTQMRNLDEAGKSIKKTIVLDSTFEQAYRNLAIIDYIKEDYKSSLFNFEKFLSITDDENAKKLYAKTLRI